MENPQLVIPGTFMAYEGLLNEADRSAVLEYLTSHE